jgi:hypothetical protein
VDAAVDTGADTDAALTCEIAVTDGDTDAAVTDADTDAALGC